jgi:hypothetical protein
VVGADLQTGLPDIGVAAVFALQIPGLTTDTVSHGQGPGGVFDEMAGIIISADLVLAGNGNAGLHRDSAQLGDTNAAGGLGVDELLLVIPIEGIDELRGQPVHLKINDTAGGHAGILVTALLMPLTVDQDNTLPGHGIQFLLKLIAGHSHAGLLEAAMDGLNGFQLEGRQIGGYLRLFRSKQLR